MTTAPSEFFSINERRAILERAIGTFLQHGYHVEVLSDTRAVVVKRRRVRVLLNLALTLITGGLWLVVLALRLLNWPVDTATLTVDPHGEVAGEFS